MSTPIHSLTPCASPSRPCANGSANPGSSSRCPALAIASTLHPATDVGQRTVSRRPGPSVRLKLTLSYVGFLIVTGFLMLAAAWLTGRPGESPDFLLRYIPDSV